MSKFDISFFEYFAALERKIRLTPLNLGGVIGSGGGGGGPPGGYIGLLPQSRVTYDTTEAEILGFISENPYDASGTLVSGSLVDNLNHIRYRIAALEGGGVPSGDWVTEFIDLTDTPATYAGEANKVVSVKGDESGLEFTSAGAVTFLDLSDTPSSYTGQSEKYIRVNTGETAIEFVDAPTGSGGGASTFLDLSDTPSDYTGQGGKTVKVNSGETALEFVTVAGGGDVTEYTNGWKITKGTVSSRTLLHREAFQTDATGDTRGTYAVDLQSYRASAAYNAYVAGGNYSFIGAGLHNQIGYGSTYAGIVAGWRNRMLGANIESSILGGLYNTIASGVSLATILGGYNNTLNDSGTALNSDSGIVDATHALVVGWDARGRQVNGITHSNYASNHEGDSQGSHLVVSTLANFNDTSWHDLYLDNGSAYISLYDDPSTYYEGQVMGFEGLVVGSNNYSDTSDYRKALFKIIGLASVKNGTSQLDFVSVSGMALLNCSTWECQVIVDDPTDTLRIQVRDSAGSGTQSTTWTGHIYTAETMHRYS